MSVVDTVLSKLGYIKAPTQKMPTPDWARAGANVEQWEIGPETPMIWRNQGDLYAKMSWVATAIERSALACAAQPFSVKTLAGEDAKDIPNHDFERLLFNPNPLQSRHEFLVGTFSYFKLTGNAFWWLNRASEKDAPAEIWLIPTRSIRPVPDGNLFLKGYVYDPGDGQEIPLEPWEVVHFKRFNPHSMFVGLSPIEAVATQASADLARVNWDAKLYNEENGRLPGILAFADPVSDPDWERLKREARSKANKREMLMLRGAGQGGVSWISATMANNDMQFLESRTFTKEEIFSLFAPGLASMLAVNATEANSKAGKATFAEYSVWPDLDNVAQKITKSVLNTYGENLVGAFDDPRVKDRVLELQEIAEYSKTHTIEEIRKKYYQDKPLGDERDKLLPLQINATSGNVQEPPAPLAPPAQPGEMPQKPAHPEENAQEQPPEKPVDEELSKWRKKATKRLKEHQSAAVEFASDLIPDDLRARIAAKLATAQTVEEVAAAFSPLPHPERMLAELQRANALLERLGVSNA